MERVSKVTVVLLFFISIFLYVQGVSVLGTNGLKETNNILSSADGKVSEECDCGAYGLCEFEGGQKKCKCTPLTIEFEGKCVECNCGKFSKSCSYSTNGTKVCDCHTDYIDADGQCTKCVCGVHGLCKIEFGKKKCICSPNYVEVNGKCQACECGEATDSCDLDSSGKKRCVCLWGYKESNGTCAECNCGRWGSCRYENGIRKCMCELYYSERNGTCEQCSCGDKSSSCYFDSQLDKKCNCYLGYAQKDGSCKECDCGGYGSCFFENGRKRCKCNSFTFEKNGMCIIIATTTDVPARTTQACDCGPHGTCTSAKGWNKCECEQGFAENNGTCKACDCGENSIDCHLNMAGERICDCHCGHLQNEGYCQECNCGPYGGCTFINGTKQCFCMPFAVEVNGVCVDFGTTSDGATDSPITSTFVSSTVQECDCGSRGSCTFENGQKKCICDPFTSEKDGKCVDICNEDKCLHGKCEIIENGFVCRCYNGFTGQRCEEKIPITSNKQDLWMVMILSVTFAIFILLSGMFCFWTHILNKMSKK